MPEWHLKLEITICDLKAGSARPIKITNCDLEAPTDQQVPARLSARGDPGAVGHLGP